MESRDVRLTQQQIDELMSRQPQLAKQSYEQIRSITPQSLEVISRQATLNIGTIGHVAHGKSTLVRAISGVHTVKFKNEKVRNITIRLGYANAKIYRCANCPSPQCYKPYPSNMTDTPKCDNEGCGQIMQLVRQVSFVDCPGHDILMSTMLTGAAVMDCAILLIAGNMKCPQPQTQEHLRAIQIMQLKDILVVQNKVDIVFKEEGAIQENFEQIKNFVKDFLQYVPPIIPCSAQLKYNIDAVCQYICEYFPSPKRDFQAVPKMIIIRSFDVNKAGEEVEKLRGGVVGGSITQGILRVGDEIEIRPGYIEKDKEQMKIKVTPIKSRIITLKADENDLLYAVPGGLIAVGLMLDPSLTRNDRLIGNVLGYPQQLPDVYIGIVVKFFLLRRLIVKNQDPTKDQSTKVEKIKKEETLQFNVGSTQTPGQVIGVKDDLMKVKLNSPICTQIGEKVAFCRKIDNKFRLIGWGEIKEGTAVQIV